MRPAWMPNWRGQTCFILGGGPSLRGFDAEILRGRGPVIGINEAGLTMAPWCDVLFWADRQWLEWNGSRLHLHTGALKVHRHIGRVDGARRIGFRSGRLWPLANAVGGHDSGSSCINLAWHFRAARIVLLGFDCHDLPVSRWQEGNWHSAHKKAPPEGQRANKFLPAHRMIAADLGRRGRADMVINATPGSALDCWPIMPLDEILGGDDDQSRVA